MKCIPIILFLNLGVKQTKMAENIPTTSTSQIHPVHEQKYPPKTSQNQNQPKQYNNQGPQQMTQQFGNQGRPKSGGTHHNKPNFNISRLA